MGHDQPPQHRLNYSSQICELLLSLFLFNISIGKTKQKYIYIYKYIPASCWKNLDAVRRGLSLLPSVSDGAKLLPATGGPVAPDLEAGPTRGKKGGSKRGQRIPFKNLFQESFPRIFVKNLCQESLSRILEEF